MALLLMHQWMISLRIHLRFTASSGTSTCIISITASRFLRNFSLGQLSEPSLILTIMACPKIGKGRAVAIRQTNTRHGQTNTVTQHKIRIAHNPNELDSTKTLL
jgi:hypothetical protein